MLAFVKRSILVFAVALVAVGAPSTPPERPQIHVFSCQTLSGAYTPYTNQVGLAVRFRNESSQALRSIVWRAKYGSGSLDFIDDGTFSPGVQIDNYPLFEVGRTQFNWAGALGDTVALLVGVPANSPLETTKIVLPTLIGTEDPENCTIVRTISESGTLWLNPAIPQQPPALPAEVVAAASTPSPKPSLGAPARPTAAPTAAPTPSAEGSALALFVCQLNIGGGANLWVGFQNLADRVATRVVIRAPYDGSAFDFADAGHFSKGATIDHTLHTAVPGSIATRTYVSDGNPRDCQVVSVTYTDGTSWKNPDAGTTPPPAPTPIPNALELRSATFRWGSPHFLPTPLPATSPSAASSP